MKKALLTVLLLLGAAIGAFALSMRAEVLPVSGDFSVIVPTARPPADMTVAVLHAGAMEARAALAYRGGSFGDARSFGMTPVLVRHPAGTLLIDAGFGRNVDAHFQTTPPLMRATSRYTKEAPAADQLQAAGITPTAVVLTHAHWDHVSGVEDFPGVPVWVPKAELEFVNSGHRMVTLAASFGTERYRTYDFTDGAYLGFDTSYDVFKDGSVVIVPAPGHTPGSVIVFVTPPGERRYAFVGDLVWQKEGIDIPARRPWLTRRIADHDEKLVQRWIGHMHKLQQAVPNLVIVPAHDRRPLEGLPRLGSDARGKA